MGSTVLKTAAWLAFAFVLIYFVLSVAGGSTDSGVGCAMFGVPFWLIALKFGSDLAKRERLAEAAQKEAVRQGTRPQG